MKPSQASVAGKHKRWSKRERETQDSVRTYVDCTRGKNVIYVGRYIDY